MATRSPQEDGNNVDFTDSKQIFIYFLSLITSQWILGYKMDRCPECNFQLTLQFDRFKDKRYTNWIKSSLCLQHTKEGLETFVETTTNEYYEDVEDLISCAVNCTQCTSDDIPSRSAKCSNCKRLVTKIRVSCNSGKPTWNNTNLKEMMASQNNVAKLFMPSRCRNYSTPEKGDITALLSFLSECKKARLKIGNPGVIIAVRNSRNDVMHSGTMLLEEQQLEEIKNRCVTLLMDQKHLKYDTNCQNAIDSILKIVGNSIHIDFVKEEKNAFDEHNKHVEGELTDLKSEVESSECTLEDIEEAKQRVKEIEEYQTGMTATFDWLGHDSKKLHEIKEMASDILKKAEAKSNIIKNSTLQTKVSDLKQDLDKQVARNNDLEEQIKQLNRAREEDHAQMKHIMSEPRTSVHDGKNNADLSDPKTSAHDENKNDGLSDPKTSVHDENNKNDGMSDPKTSAHDENKNDGLSDPKTSVHDENKNYGLSDPKTSVHDEKKNDGLSNPKTSVHDENKNDGMSDPKTSVHDENKNDGLSDPKTSVHDENKNDGLSDPKTSVHDENKNDGLSDPKTSVHDENKNDGLSDPKTSVHDENKNDGLSDPKTSVHDENKNDVLSDPKTSVHDENKNDGLSDPKTSVHDENKNDGLSDPKTSVHDENKNDGLSDPMTSAHDDNKNAGTTVSFKISDRDTQIAYAVVDCDTVFLPRCDSMDSNAVPSPLLKKRAKSIDDDNFSICSNDDLLDKQDFEETITEESFNKYKSEQLRMRHLVVLRILKSEKSLIDQLCKAKSYLQSIAMQSNELHLEDITTIFYQMDEIHKVHKDFVHELDSKLKSWTDDQEVANAFKTLAVYFLETLRKYQENEDTRHFLEELMEVFKDDSMRLKEMLLKPVQRIQTNNLVLHDLIRHTPESHADYEILKKALKLSEENLKTYNDQQATRSRKRDAPESRHLVKSGFRLEVSRDKKQTRQLRYVCLFNDLLICTKHKGGSRHKDGSFKFLWSLPVSALCIHMKGERKFLLKESLEDLKCKIGNLKLELREEMLKAHGVKDKSFFLSHKKITRNLKKLKKKVQEQEAILVEWREAVESMWNRYKEFERRFEFHSASEFPPPEPMGTTNKTYPSKDLKNSNTGPVF